MATYFQAAKAVKVFTEYKRLALAYWEAQPRDNRGWMGRDLPRPENDESSRIREQIIHLYPEASASADEIGVNVIAQNFPPPNIGGGPVIPVNLLLGVVDQDQGYSHLSKQRVLDTVERFLAEATALKRRLLWRQLLNPIWWIIEIVAYVLRIPFLILQRAGVPKTVEESIWGHMVKVVVFVVMILIGLHYGLNLSAKDLLSWIK